ncbi:MAG: aminoacyl-tRNA hydrolase [Myxococcota bacterium]
MSRYLIAGLGNPGTKYAGTRHNIGFMAVDRLAERHRMSLGTEKFDGRFDTGVIGREKVALLEPQTFMNRSGRSVQAAASFYDVPTDQIIVVHDEIDLDVGQLRLKAGGGHGGHNGLRDIAQKLGTKDFLRVRLGVGRPEHGDVTNHVLGQFQRDEQPLVDDLIERGCDAIELLLSDGLARAQNRFH